MLKRLRIQTNQTFRLIKIRRLRIPSQQIHLFKIQTTHHHPVNPGPKNSKATPSHAISGIVPPSPPERVRRVGGALSNRSTNPCQPVFLPPRLFSKPTNQASQNKRKSKTNQQTVANSLATR